NRFNDRHSLSFTTWGAPTERAQLGSSTEEAYWLANDHYYNPNWGYQNGKKRNARIVNSYEPTAILTWDFDIDDRTKLSTSFTGKYSMYASSALGWSGNAADPRPDYYKKLPSGQINGNVFQQPLSDEDVDTWQNAYDYWTSSKAHRQLDWDGMYFANAQQNALGGEALYYVENRHNDQLAFNFGSTLKRDMEQFGNITAGVEVSTTKGMHYKTMKDLLGADSYTDIDKFSLRDYGYNSSMIQNDLDNPNRQIGKGDKFGYNYNIFVNKGDAWANYQYTKGFFSLFAAGKLGGTTIEREGLMRNGRAANNSKGSSGTAKFLEGAAKVGATFRITGKHVFNIGVGYEQNAPLPYNAFIAPRLKNDFAANLSDEEVITTEASYAYNGPVFAFKVGGYYTRFNKVTELDQFYNDQESRYTYLSMTGIQKEYMGVEVAASVKLTSNLTLKALGTFSNAEYINNPDANLTYENESETSKDKVYIDGMKESGTPLSAYSLGLDYNVKGWFFSINGNYYNRGYIDFSTYRRLGKVLGIPQGGNGTIGDDGKVVNVSIPGQEEFDGGFMLDLSIGKYIRLQKGRSLSINRTLNNETNNTNMKTGGYEQNRDDAYEDGRERPYQFSRHSKYYYAQGINGFFNIGFRY
ncbi:MAG: TonB-dependent receptor, partial [Paraprevotella sp.]|nr:TonB-dependent receptor [Paraprevotella sp.]